MNKVSQLFWPVLVTPKNAVIKNVEGISRSQKLMTEMGLIKSATNGTFQVLPLAQRSVDKCINLLNSHMEALGAQKLTLPTLTSAALWEKTGRLNGDITEFYMVRDRHNKEYILSPTHEESITALLAASAPITYRQLPLRLYQIGPKFRDELKARFGLIRAKEFLMKDLYTFDRTPEEARITYKHVSEIYCSILSKLQVPFVKVKADTGMMGGSLSHEYHFLTAAGEEKLLVCSDCSNAVKIEGDDLPCCSQCSSSNVTHERGIEVAHTFLLGAKYSKPLGASYLQSNGKPTNVEMGCYGVGVTRLLAAALEALSGEHQLRWPMLLTPFDVCIIGPKEGSKEQCVGDRIESTLCTSLAEVLNPADVLHDDRKHLTIGKRLLDSKRMGYPLIVVIGSKVLQERPKLELHMNEEVLELEPGDVVKIVCKHNAAKIRLLESKTYPHPSASNKEIGNISGAILSATVK